jgi:hypothetical protein
MNMSSFSDNKKLKFIITLGTGKFGSQDNDQIIIEGFRSAVSIDKAGGMQMSTLTAKINGISQADMNAITTVTWQPLVEIRNTIEVFAIDGTVETSIFSGDIYNAWGDYQSMPDVFLYILANVGQFNKMKTVEPRSFKGISDTASVMAQIAAEMDYSFENNGVDVKISNLYLANTAMEQAIELAKTAKCDMYIDGEVLAITPMNQPINTIIPLISAESGLIGYPTFDGTGINCQILFNPAVVFGGAIKLETDIARAAGEWIVTSLSYQLESDRPGGAWFTQIRGNKSGLAITK